MKYLNQTNSVDNGAPSGQKFRLLSVSALILGTAFLLSSCAALSRAPIPGFGDEELNKLGTDTFEELKSKTPIETSSRTNAYVKCVANAILAVSEDDTGVDTWEIVVFRDASANAFALPGGKIGVHTGLLTVAKTPAQLAAVLGHEVGHVTERHGKQRMMQSMGAQKVIEIIGGGEGEEGMMAQVLGAGATYGLILPFSRSHETQADTIGIKLMSKAGFHPQESVQLWKNMKAASGGSNPEFMSTHPSNDKRIKDLQNQVTKNMVSYEAARRTGKKPNCRP